MTEDEALAAYIAAGKVLNAAAWTADTGAKMDAAIPYWNAKIKLFEIRKSNGKFPSDTCDGCRQVGGCCNRHWHHVGDCCIHCGNDEREL